MEYSIFIGGIRFYVNSRIALKSEESMKPFLVSDMDRTDVYIEINTEYEKAPKPTDNLSGEDLLLEYYKSADGWICLAKGSYKGYLSTTICSRDYKRIICYINRERFLEQAHTLGNILRLLPIRMILQNYGVLFFHGSQIAIENVGILFTAPSGTGKTTQAKLWKKYRNAKIVCNDRTLVKGNRTYGYPVDGSEPIISGEIHDLGAIVLLKQDNENIIQRLRPGTALAKLLEQMVFDTWNYEEHELAFRNVMELLKRKPVYLLKCTPDLGAIVCLEEQLIKDGII